MAKLDRIIQKIFASQAGSNERGQIGSLAAGTPTFTNDPEEIQDLGNFEDGLFGVVVGANSPAIEDINSLYFLITRQIAYLLQSGIAEYKNDEIYYTGSGCRDEENLYFSKIDDNEGEDLDHQTKWAKIPFDISKKLSSLKFSNFSNFVAFRGDQVLTVLTGTIGGLADCQLVSGNGKTVITFATEAATTSWENFLTIDKTTGVSGGDLFPRTIFDGGRLTFENGIFFLPTSGATSQGNYSATNAILTSTDGETWTQRNAAQEGQWKKVRYLNGLYFCVGRRTDSPLPGIMTSPDGANWLNSLVGAPNAIIYDVAFDGTNYVAVGENIGTSSPVVLTSTDGLGWGEVTGLSLGAGMFDNIVYFEGLLVASKSNKSSPTGDLIFVSDDGGATWSGVTMGLLDGVSELAVCEGVLIAQGYSDDVIYTSVDALEWKVCPSSIPDLNANSVLIRGGYDDGHYTYGVYDTQAGQVLSLINSLSGFEIV
tara:strand:- start:11290 stop:12738 length:1449 start_codon:yes stop_codon:yes gene_type:complete